MEEHLLIVDSRGRSLVSRLNPGCRECLTKELRQSVLSTDCPTKEQRRRGTQAGPTGTVYLCSAASDLLASSKKFRRVLELYLESIGTVQEWRTEMEGALEADNRRLAHNITTQNAHILQEIHSLVPQDKLGGDARSQLDEIEKALTSDPKGSSKALLRVLKNSTAVKSELAVFRRLRDRRPDYRPKNHKIHQVLTNVLSTFFQDFQDKAVNWHLDQCHAEMLVDYESFSAALYHLIDNTHKYTSYNSAVRVSFQAAADVYQITFAMTSLAIRQHEVEKIFDEGYSGEVASNAGRAGSGIGMFVARELLRTNKCEIRVIPGAPSVANNPDLQYAENQFIVSLPLRFVRDMTLPK